jgi:hypothetical protein
MVCARCMRTVYAHGVRIVLMLMLMLTLMLVCAVYTRGTVYDGMLYARCVHGVRARAALLVRRIGVWSASCSGSPSARSLWERRFESPSDRRLGSD